MLRAESFSAVFVSSLGSVAKGLEGIQLVKREKVEGVGVGEVVAVSFFSVSDLEIVDIDQPVFLAFFSLCALQAQIPR